MKHVVIRRVVQIGLPVIMVAISIRIGGFLGGCIFILTLMPVVDWITERLYSFWRERYISRSRDG